MKDQSKIIKGF